MTLYLTTRYLRSYLLFVLIPFGMVFIFFGGKFEGSEAVRATVAMFGAWFTYCYLINFSACLLFLRRAKVYVYSRANGLLAVDDRYHLLSTRGCPWLLRKNKWITRSELSENHVLTITTSDEEDLDFFDWVSFAFIPFYGYRRKFPRSDSIAVPASNPIEATTIQLNLRGLIVSPFFKAKHPHRPMSFFKLFLISLAALIGFLVLGKLLLNTTHRF